jgi:hypothetical protein
LLNPFFSCRALDCFHSLALVNNAAMNIDMQCLYCILTYIPSDICPGVVSLDHMVFLFLRDPHTAFHRVILIYIPTNSVLEFLSPHILTNICYF